MTWSPEAAPSHHCRGSDTKPSANPHCAATTDTATLIYCSPPSVSPTKKDAFFQQRVEHRGQRGSGNDVISTIFLSSLFVLSSYHVVTWHIMHCSILSSFTDKLLVKEIKLAENSPDAKIKTHICGHYPVVHRLPTPIADSNELKQLRTQKRALRLHKTTEKCATDI